MFSIRGTNVNEAFQEALHLMKQCSIEADSRNGRVKMLPEPCGITYEYPNERVLFSAKRDCNPFFHFMESLWMLYGSRDVKWISQFNGNIGRYSDDGKVFHGAYGHRWRHHFDQDQLEWLVLHLRAEPNSRRAVLAMWDPNYDLVETKDLPCNTHAYFAVRPTGLDMSVVNRSNDLVWGALGANAVHFSVLHEYMSWRIGVPQGLYHQITNNLHIYEQHWPMLEDEYLLHGPTFARPYPPTIPLATVHDSHRLFNIELDRFMNQDHHALTDHYQLQIFNAVAKPMMCAWNARKEGVGTGTTMLGQMSYCDWAVACQEWIERHAKSLG